MEFFVKVGENVYIRTLSFNYVGHVTAVYADGIVLDQASWIAEDDRFNNTLKTGSFREVEPYVDPVFVSRSIITDVTPWRHALPKEPK